MYRLPVALVLLIEIAGPSPAWANMAAPWKAGSRVAEPAGLKSVVIESENLVIDLRPLASAFPAVVEATYRLRNAGERREVDLVFVAGSPIGREVRVRLDEADVPHLRAEGKELPPHWQPPRTTPRIRGEGGLSYYVRKDQLSVLKFTVALPAGPSSLQVRYEAEASALSGDAPTRYWQLAYVLAPAREWGGFGDLRVTVHMPPGWNAASTPELTRSGDELTATFNGLPSDALALTVQFPPPWSERTLDALGTTSWVLAIAVGAILSWWLGRSVGRRQSEGAGWPFGLVAGLLWTVLLFAAAILSTVGRANLGVPPGQRAWNYGYGMNLAFLVGAFFALLGLPVGLILARLAARWARRRTGEVADDLALGLVRAQVK
jgi:hypothetical protein